MDHNALVSTGSQIIKNWTGLAFLLILVVGAFLRFAWLGTVRHGYDNAYQIYDAVRLLDGGEWLLIGQPSSVFLDNPPLMAYLQSIALLVWRSPWSAYLLVTTLNTAAIWFVYALGSDLKGRPFGLLAALLFAVNPWLVHYSRFTWTQGLLPFFLAAAAWGLWPALATGRREPRRLLLGLLALAAMIQTYVLALVVLAPVVLLLIVFRQHLPRRSALAGLLAILLGLVAYALGLSTRLEANLAKLALFASGGDGAGLGFNLEAIEHTVRLVTGNEYGADLTAPLWLDMLVRLVHLLLLAALLAGAVRALRALRRDTPDRRLAFVLFAWLLLPALGFALLPFPVHPHYLLVTLPAGFPSTYSVSLKGPYVVDEDRQPSFIDYAVEEVEVSLDTLQVSMENYLRPMSVHERSQFFSSMAQKLGAGRISDVPGLLKAMSLYQEEKFLAAYAPGFFGLYDVYQCDLLLQMGLGARPEVMDNPLTFNHETCN